MDFSLKDIIQRCQEEKAPFIGDLMDRNELETMEIEKKNIEVTSLIFDGQRFHGEVVLTADFTEADDRFDYVIVGVRLIIKPDRTDFKQEIPAVWTIPGFTKVSQVEVGIDISPAPAVLATLLLMSLEDFSQLTMERVSLIQSYSIFSSIDIAISNHHKFHQELSNAIVEDDLAKMKESCIFLSQLQPLVKNRVQTVTSYLNAENWVKATHYVMRKVKWVEQKLEASDNFLADLSSKYMKQQLLLQFFNNNQLFYTNVEKSFRQFCGTHPEFFVLYVSSNGWDSNQKVVETFLKLKRNTNEQFCVVDLDFVCLNANGVKPFVIQKFKNGVCDVSNVLQDVQKNKVNLAKCLGKRENLTPKSRAVVCMPCPGFYIAECPNFAVKWLCNDCQTHLHYGFDKNLYCYCGSSDVNNFVFRCESDSHSQDFLRLTQHDVLSKLTPMETVNIIVLGQSGVGKSTWINSFVNYMTFQSLQDAKNSDFLVPIPVKFSVTQQEPFKVIDVMCGNHEDNENLGIGESATQNCKDYNIVFENKIYNIIDTPGLGDTRGIEEDKKNVKKILDHLRRIDVIHGICLILKPNEARLTVLLKYCLKEILSNLHKSSSDNLLFCFTHARATFYRAGETLPTLKALLNEININPACLDRSFHLDNEAFRFLCCQSANIKFSKEEEITFAESWDKSVGETKKLLNAVSMMTPHQTSRTLSLNRSRNLILTIIPFMVEISENIERNLREMKNHKKTVEEHKGNLNQLKNLRFSTQIDIDRAKLDHPRTVCASQDCVEYHFMQKTRERQVIYKTHCHSHCYLSGNTPDEYPNPELTQCAAMAGTQECIVCGCSWKIHMHIWYEQNLVERLVEDQDVKRRINAYTDSSALKADLVAGAKKRIDGLEAEKKCVISTCVKFACFLKDNAIVPYNDSFLDYLETTLRNMRNIVNKTHIDQERIEKMEEMKKLYLQEKKIFIDAVQKDHRITEFDIQRAEQELYDLPENGEQLRVAVEQALNNQYHAPRDSTQATTIIADRRRPTGVLGKMKTAMLNFFSSSNPKAEFQKGRGRGDRRGRGRYHRGGRGRK